jgi:hypothetical protein
LSVETVLPIVPIDLTTFWLENQIIKKYCVYFQILQYKADMGRPARNHGGTGGHGCLPLTGERPNYNHHVLKDKTLLTLVPNTNKKSGKTTKLEILAHLPKNWEKRVHSDRQYDSVSIMEPKRLNAVSKNKPNSDRKSDDVSIKDPRKVVSSRSFDSVCIKKPIRKQYDKGGDAVSTKDPRIIQNAIAIDSASILRPKLRSSE